MHGDKRGSGSECASEGAEEREKKKKEEEREAP